MTRRLAFLGALALASPAAAATYPAPSLTLETSFSPPTGIARNDLVDQVTSIPAATAVAGDRIYTVGAAGSGNSADVGIIAQRSNGTLDTGFSEDGKLVVPIVDAGEDRAVDIVVLPDGRLRILALASSKSAVLGLLADGSRDPGFGENGIVKDIGGVPGGLAASADGRLAITGNASGVDDTFVAVRSADGSPNAAFDEDGLRQFDRSGSSTADRGLDVLFRDGGLLVLGRVGQSGFLRALTDGGADDPAFSDDGDLVLEVGEAPVEPTALAGHGNRFWVTGSARTGTDTNAFLARLEANGTGLQSRQFDMRGQLIDPATAVTSVGSAITVVPGTPDTLVVAGSVTSSAGTEWAAAAFNNLDGDLAAAGFGDIAISAPGSGGINGAAGGGGAAAVAGPYQETVTTPSSSVTYTRTGVARLVVDADKTCNLNLRVTQPLELLLVPGGPGTVGLSVTNAGTRACAGTILAASPFDIAGGPLETGVLAPGESFVSTAVAVADTGLLRRTDTVTFTLAAPADADTADNTARLAVRFRYCDLALVPPPRAGYVPSEGTRRFRFTVRNAGTVACTGVRVGVTGEGRATAARRYSVRPGKEAADDVRAGPRRPASPDSRLLMTFTVAGAVADPNAANDAATLSPTVIGVGDTDARRPRGRARTIRGTATVGLGATHARMRRLTKISVAVLRVGKTCRWLDDPRALRFRVRKAGKQGRCTRPLWLRADGLSEWRLKTAGLPAGTYELLSRATIGAGFSEASFSTKDRNRVRFTVGR